MLTTRTQVRTRGPTGLPCGLPSTRACRPAAAACTTRHAVPDRHTALGAAQQQQQQLRRRPGPGSFPQLLSPAGVWGAVKGRGRSSKVHRLLVATTTEVSKLEAPPAPDSTGQQVQEEEDKAEPAAAAGASFDWYKQWYPMRIVQDLDPSIPHAAQLLGMDLVLWRDKDGAWRCFEDRCPHRLAALSEGRIDTRSGDLYCNYHGWAWEGSGKCTSIPQLSEAQDADKVLGSPRACAVAYPTRVAEGLLWVWASAGPGAEAEAQAAEWKGLAPDLDDPSSAGIKRPSWYFRDYPGSYIAAKENNYNDPSHDTVLHHHVLPLHTRYNAQPLGNELLEMTERGYVVRSRPASRPITLLDAAVFPAGNIRTIENGPRLGVAYATPAAPSRTHVILFSRWPPAQNTGNPVADLVAAVRAETRKIPWMEHLFIHTLVDADIAIQTSVNKNRAKDPSKVYTPAAADVGPRACWTWLHRFGGGGPPTCPRPLVDLTQPQLPRRQLLDRYEQHTKHCSSCREAHATLSQLLPLAQALAAALAVAAVAVVAGRGALLAGGMLAAAAAAAAAAWLWLGRLVQQFVFVDYDKNHVSQQP